VNRVSVVIAGVVSLGIGLAFPAGTSLARTPVAYTELGEVRGAHPQVEPRSAFADLRVGEVGFSDVSTCDEYSLSWCSASDWKYATAWAFPVTNASKTRLATGVRARVKLLDSNGVELVSTIIPVASWIAPGKAVWVAPLVRITSSTSSIDGADFDRYQAGVTGVAMAEAEIVAAKWSKQRPRPWIADADADFASATSASYCWDTDRQPCLRFQAAATVTSRGATSTTYSTWVILDGDGNVMGGVRHWTEHKTGSTTQTLKWGIPVKVGSEIVDMRVGIAPR
jgi:hypothetical protein